MPTAARQRERELTMAEAARLLKLSWPQVYRLVLVKELDARQAENGRWLVTAASVRRRQARRERAAPASAVVGTR